MNVRSLTNEQQILAQAISPTMQQDLPSKTSLAVAYTQDENGKRFQPKIDINDWHLHRLIDYHKVNPFYGAEIAINNLIHIAADQRLSHPEINSRLQRYLKAYLDLHIELDHAAFPTIDLVRSGVPAYIPDGLSDMGSDPRVEQDNRNREKIRVDKQRIFKSSLPEFTNLILELAKKYSGMNKLEAQRYIIESIANSIYASRPYDKTQEKAEALAQNDDQSIFLDKIIKEEAAVCRHHALEAQIKLQFLGIRSQLLKCYTLFGEESSAHAANLVQIGSQWHLLDVTNPARVGFLNRKTPFLQPIPEKQDPYKDNLDHKWTFILNSHDHRKYTLHNNMYYRIMDNTKLKPTL